MTVGMLIDRLERFRQGILLYRECHHRNVRPPRSGSEFGDFSDFEALRDKLRQEFRLLDEYVTAFSRGRYQIHLDSRGLKDIYGQAFSEEGREWHLDIILEDLKHMLADLQQQPLQELMMLHDRGKDPQKAGTPPSFGLLGHLGNSAVPNTSGTLHAVLNLLARIIHQRIDRPEEQEKLHTHLLAIVDHPEMAELLPLPPSQLL